MSWEEYGQDWILRVKNTFFYDFNIDFENFKLFLVSVEIERSKALQSLSESASSKIVVAPLDVLNHANGLLSQTPRQ